jgi:hypothetical protein
MYKVTWFARFPEGMAPEDGRRYWTEQHGPLGAKVPQIERYVQSHQVGTIGAYDLIDVPTQFNGYSSAWYADRDAWEASVTTPEWAALGVDSPNVFQDDYFVDMSAAVEESVIVDGPEGPFKAVWIMRFPQEVRADPARLRAAHDYWIATHGGHFGVQVPGIGRYVQNHVVERVGVEGPDASSLPAFDGYSECWFQDRAAFEAMVASPEWQAMNDDALTLFDVPWSMRGMSGIVEEVLQKGDPQVAVA